MKDKNPHIWQILIATVTISVASIARAEPQPTTEPDEEGPKVVYHNRGVPVRRVGGGTRGTVDEDLKLIVLTPNEFARTISPRPTLFWYLSKAVDKPLIVSIVDTRPQNPRNLLKIEMSGTKPAGIHRLDLSDDQVMNRNQADVKAAALESGIDYRWTVAVVMDPDNRSQDILASGFVTRVAAPAALEPAKLAADPVGKAAAFAQNGMWYDALKALSDAIDKKPADQRLRAQRAGLLEQAELPEVAAAERAVGKAAAR
jgi:hypothetical protein